MDHQSSMQEVLSAARRRGQENIAGRMIPSGLDHFAVYSGLLQGAIELGKLVKTEGRDLEAIGTYHAVEMAKIEAALREVETAMLADFQRDQSLREKTFQAINALIEAGQYEVAGQFHERLIKSLHRPALETIVGLRNDAAAHSGTQWHLR